MGDLSGRRVSGGSLAPTLFVRYLCRVCGSTGVLDAYDGPPRCQNDHAPTFMEGLSVVRSTPPFPNPHPTEAEHTEMLERGQGVAEARAKKSAGGPPTRVATDAMDSVLGDS